MGHVFSFTNATRPDQRTRIINHIGGIQDMLEFLPFESAQDCALVTAPDKDGFTVIVLNEVVKSVVRGAADLHYLAMLSGAYIAAQRTHIAQSWLEFQAYYNETGDAEIYDGLVQGDFSVCAEQILITHAQQAPYDGAKVGAALYKSSAMLRELDGMRRSLLECPPTRHNIVSLPPRHGPA